MILLWFLLWLLLRLPLWHSLMSFRTEPPIEPPVESPSISHPSSLPHRLFSALLNSHRNKRTRVRVALLLSFQRQSGYGNQYVQSPSEGNRSWVLKQHPFAISMKTNSRVAGLEEWHRTMIEVVD